MHRRREKRSVSNFENNTDDTHKIMDRKSKGIKKNTNKKYN